MPSASITSTVNGASPLTSVSRDDLVVGDVVTVASAASHTSYSWTLAYRPPGSAAVFSGSATAASPGSFTVDVDGPYLVRLTADLGLSTETVQYVRLRALTTLGSLHLTAAGEGYGGSIPVPVDQTPTGWADALNSNLTSLLALTSSTSASGRVVSVDPEEGYGDYGSIQDAIDAVSGSASVTTPYVVRVNPGTYVEDVTFAPHVHVVGWPGNLTGVGAARVVVVRGAHSTTLASPTALLQLAHLTLENVSPSTAPVLEVTGAGTLSVYKCELVQEGLNAGQGAALLLTSASSVQVSGCQISAHASLPDDRAAFQTSGATSARLTDCTITGPTGAVLGSGGDVAFLDCPILGTGVTGAGISSDATTLLVERCEVLSDSGESIRAHPSGAALTGSVSVDVRFSSLDGITFDRTGISGSSTLLLGSCQHGTLAFPGGALTSLSATTLSSTIAYDPTSSGLAATEVQSAIDEVAALAVLIRTLDDAYDGGTTGSGSGRTIIADAGPVRISDAPSPSDPPPAGGGNGMLEVVGGVRVGAVDYPEIDLNPNPYGSGPSVTLGSRVVPTNNSWGAGTATIQASSTGSPDYRNYNLRVQTQDADGGGEVGRLIVRAGGGLNSGGTTPDGGSLYLQAGDAGDAGAVAGDIFLSPGMTSGGAPGTIYLVGPAGSSGATLTASGPCSDPLGVTGDARFATSFGAVTASFLSTDSLATVVSKLDALPGLSASESGGVLTLETDEQGATAELYFLSADAGVDAALGGFDGVLQVDGAFSRTIRVDVTDIEEISIGTGGATGPMVYNSDTGKLTVPGVIDPTAIIFEEAGPPTTTGTEGALFVSDGSSGLTAGALYYVGPSSGIPTAVVSGGGFTFPTSAAPSQTGEGEAVWDTNDDALTVGTGSGRVILVGDNTPAGGDLSGTYPNPTVTDLTIAGEVQGAILYFDGTNWVSLSPSTAGYVLQTNGAGADPTWSPASSGSGDVVGPASSTSNGLARFDGITGKLLKDTASWTLSDAGELSGAAGSLVLPQGASAAPTSEGSLAWDTDDDLLKVGTGAATLVMVDTTSTQALSSKTLTSPTINGGTHTAVTSLGVRSTGSGAFDLTIRNTENLSAGRALTLTVSDADRLLSLSGDLVLSGGFSTTLAVTGVTSVTLPTTGTLLSSTSAAGGDLSGIYPNPTVTQARGLRETSGPTTLAMGAVADGQVLRRIGSTIVGINLLAYIAIAGPLEAVLIPDGTATSTGTLV